MSQVRVSKDRMFLDMASLVAKRGTCVRAQVGCVLTNGLGHVLATGYNGTARGLPHCITEPCPGANVPIGQGTGTCEAIHAEQNALLQCPDVMKIHTCYVTMAPCLDCTKLLLNTSCQWIIYLEDHPKMQASKDLWTKAKGPACFVSWDYLKEISESLKGCTHDFYYNYEKADWQCIKCGKIGPKDI